LTTPPPPRPYALSLHDALPICPRRTALPPVTDTAVGAPTPSAVAAGNRKVTALKRRIGPDSVVLSPNEVAALIGGGIDWSVRKTDRKSTRLNSSHRTISYAVFC